MNKAFQFVSQNGAAGDDPEKAARRADLQGRAASAEGTAEQLEEGEIPGAAHKAVEDQIAGIESEAREAGLEIAEATRAKDKLAAKARDVMLRREQEDTKRQDNASGVTHETRDFLDDPLGWLMDVAAIAVGRKMQEIEAAAGAGAEQRIQEYLQQNPETPTQGGQGDSEKDIEVSPSQNHSGGGAVLKGLVEKFQAEQGGAPLPKFDAECLGDQVMPSTGPTAVRAASPQRVASLPPKR